jgi:hypothetical protein
VSSRYGCRVRHDATDAAAMWYCDRQLHAGFQPISVDQVLGRNFRFWPQ